MKLDCVLTATNENPLYLECIPIFVTTWKRLFPEVDVKIVLVADTIPQEYNDYSEYICLFKPIDGVSTAFTAQYIRCLYPALLNCENGVLITDIDILPMNRAYYIDPISNLPNDKFVVYRPVCLDIKELTICYNIAAPPIWGEIFGISNEQDVIEHLKKQYSDIEYDGLHGGKGWQTDQRNLYTYVCKWDKQIHFLCDKKTNFKRLCRDKHHCIHVGIENDIKNLKFTDYHIHRPYHKFKDFVDYVVRLLPNNGTLHTGESKPNGKQN